MNHKRWRRIRGCRIPIFYNLWRSLEKAGFEILSKDWLDKFPSFKQARHKDFVEYIYRIAEKYDSTVEHISFGAVEPKKYYDLPLEYAAFYVIGRNSGEGEDRNLVKGNFFNKFRNSRYFIFEQKIWKIYVSFKCSGSCRSYTCKRS